MGVLLAPLLFLATAVLFFPSAGRDDLHITLWPAHTLAEQGELLNYNGERVEQSSTLLWVVLLAALRRITSLELTALAHLGSLGFGLLCFWLLSKIGRSELGRRTSLLAALVLATNPYFVYWSASGMEVPLVASLFLGIIVLLPASRQSRKALLLIGLAAAAAVAARPEVVIVLAAVASLLLCIIWRSPTPTARGELKAVLVLLLAAVCAFGLLVLFRWTYFDSLFPQPVYKKVFFAAAQRGLLTNLERGFGYLLFGGPRHVNFISMYQSRGGGLFPFLLPLLGLAILDAARSLRDLLLGTGGAHALMRLASGLMTGAYLGFCVTVGGDWMEGMRFLAPVFPLMALNAAHTLSGLEGRKAAVVTFLVVACGAAGTLNFQRTASASLPLWYAGLRVPGEDLQAYSWFERTNRENARDFVVVRVLSEQIDEARRSGHRISIWSSQMGFVPYHLSLRFPGQLRFFDLAGLTDRIRTSCARSPAPGQSFEALALRCGAQPWELLYELVGTDLAVDDTMLVLKRDHVPVKARSMFGLEPEFVEYGLIWRRMGQAVPTPNSN